MRANAALVGGVRTSLRAVLGPCPCQSCGRPVYWARSVTRHYGESVPGIPTWRDQTGGIHPCNPLAKYGSRRRRAA